MSTSPQAERGARSHRSPLTSQLVLLRSAAVGYDVRAVTRGGKREVGRQQASEAKNVQSAKLPVPEKQSCRFGGDGRCGGNDKIEVPRRHGLCLPPDFLYALLLIQGVASAVFAGLNSPSGHEIPTD